MIGASALGSMWRKRMRAGEAPMTRSAMTKSRSRRVSASPRTTRAAPGTLSTAMAIMAFVRLSAAVTASAKTRPGKAAALHDAHEDGIDGAARVARDEADDGADHHRHGDDEEAGVERDTRAVEDAGENVAAEVVGAQWVALGAWMTWIPGRILIRVVGGDQGREDGGENRERDEGDPDHAEALAAEGGAESQRCPWGGV